MLSNDVTHMSMRFLHAGAMKNLTYTRTVPNCIPSSGVHLSSPIRLFTGLTGYIRWDLETIFLVTSRNNRLDVQTVISQRDKVHLAAFNRKQ